MPLKLKTVTIEGKVYAEVNDGKPVFIHDDNTEHPFDADAATTRIAGLNREAQTRREEKEALEVSLAKFKDIDPDKARTALDTIKNFDDKKLVEAGKVEEIKQAAINAVEEKYKPVVTERDGLKTELYGERLSNKFANSKFIADKMSVPAEVVKSVFAKHFKDEGGKPVAYDQAGNKLWSRSNPGAEPDFDEALTTIVEAYAYKDTLLKGTGGGSGKKENGPGNGPGTTGKTVSRADWDKMDLATRDQQFKDGVRPVDA